MNMGLLRERPTLLEDISDSKICEPTNMPAAIFLREAEAMIAAGRRDLAALERVGFAGGLLRFSSSVMS